MRQTALLDKKEDRVMSTIKTSKEILELMKKEGVEVVDLRFMDFPGLWQILVVGGNLNNKSLIDRKKHFLHIQCAGRLL